MTSLRRGASLTVLVLALGACGGGTGSDDSGARGMDAPAVGQDAPSSTTEDAPSSTTDDAASSTTDDARSAEDAPSSTTEDAPSASDDAPSTSDDAAASDDAFAMGAFCGGIASIPCRSRAQYCDESCAIPDAGGVCRDRPTVCTGDVAPVCGCDGTTYTNACQAAMAGVSVLSDGACPGSSDCRVDGCTMGQSCCTVGRRSGTCYDPRCLACCM